MMKKTSIIIACRNEFHEVAPGVTVLQRTVQDILEKATGEFEILVGYDGPPYQDLPDLCNVKQMRFKEPIGLKALLNRLVEAADGDYVLKLDSHCMVSKGFDRELQRHMEDNWVVTPRFYVLDADKWAWQDDRHYDYFYLCCPFTDPRGLRFKAGGHWPERTAEREKISDFDIDETPQIHGSAWFVKKSYYIDELEGFPEENSEIFHAQEPINLGLKCWLMGGKVMVNKNCSYAHWHQQNNQRGYHQTKENEQLAYTSVADYWLKDKWPKRKYDFRWFIRKFYPMPTWPENWEEILTNYQEGKEPIRPLT